MTEYDIISREEWGAKYANGFGPRPVGNLITRLHHSVTIAPDLLPPFTDDYAAVRALEAIGQSRFGKGMSYNTLFTPAGLIFEGLGIDRVGAHTGGANTPTAGLCLVGNYEKDKPPRPMLEAISWYLQYGVGRWWTDAKLDGGHRDVASTACPGKYAYELIDNINRGEYRNGEAPEAPAKPKPEPEVPDRLKEDGFWGESTTRKLQKALGTPVDGKVSSQPSVWQRSNPGLTTGWDWTDNPRGSRMIVALQAKIGAVQDGKFGPNSIRRLQITMGTPVDGILSRESRAIMALQHRLNMGNI
jgi:hypothetical protein